MRFTGKVALVTGASRGIGQASAVALAREGAHVAVNFNSTEAGATETLRRIREAGGEAEAFQADMGDRAQIEALIASTIDRFGRLDVYINNANAGRRTRDLPRGFLDVSDDQLYQEFFVPFRACYAGGQLAARQMVAQGSGGAIVNITSVHQERAWRNDSVYGSMKAAVRRLTMSQARELAPHRIRVNAVAPGFIDIRAHPGERGVWYDGQNDRAAEEVPLGRGMPDDIANAVLYLASNDARYVTGTYVLVDGGMLISPNTDV